MTTTIWTIRGYTLTMRGPEEFELRNKDGIGYSIWIEEGAICAPSLSMVWVPKDVRARTFSAVRRLTGVKESVA